MIHVVEDEPSLLQAVVEFLKARGFDTQGFGDAEEALASAQRAPPDALVTDVQLPGMTGLELVERVAEIDASVVRVVMTAHADVQSAVRAVRAGCYEYLEKPVDLPRLARLLGRALDERRSRVELTWHRAHRGGSSSEIRGESAAAQALRAEIARTAALYAPAPPTLITGETGVGKSLVARQIHDAGAGRGAPWIEVNCAALPASLIEAELFGYERAAFTDAKAAKPGLIEAASGGTLFLDEIGEMPPEAQAKLLGVVEGGRVRRIGALRDRKVEVTILAATNIELEAAVASGRFRADLFHRLAALRIEPPPLRERGRDVLLLAQDFLDAAASRYRRAATRFDEEAEAALLTHPWPGNIRELRFAVERAALAAPADLPILGVGFLSLAPAGAGKTAKPAPNVSSAPTWAPSAHLGSEGGRVSVRLPEGGIAFDELERAILEAALRRTGGNVAQAAELLDLKRDAMRYRVKRLGLDPRRIGLASLNDDK